MLIVIHGGTMLVDDDFVPPSSYIRVDRGGYAIASVYSHKVGRTTVNKGVLVHRYVADAPKGLTVDHINGNRLDNRRSNLRVCSIQHNLWNKPARGWTLTKEGTYQVQIETDGKCRYIGRFKTEGEASAAYVRANLEARGDFSPFLHNRTTPQTVGGLS